MELNDIMKVRQSCRNFDATKEVKISDLEQIIEAGRMAPSARNDQPWFFTVVASKENVALVREARKIPGFNDFTTEVNAFIVMQENKDLSKEPRKDFASIDIGISCAHMILKASELGLSTCILGSFDEEKIRTNLKIENPQPIRLVLAVGYAKEDDPIRPKKRKELNDVVKYM